MNFKEKKRIYKKDCEMYSKSKIYKITNVGCDECYYGSTVQPLSKRMGQHREKYRLYKDGKGNNITSFILFDKYGLENCKIELVETYECKTKEELYQREAYYIKNNECVNKTIPGRTKKEYYEDNKDQIKEKNKEYQKEYYESNKDQIKEKKKEYRDANKDQIKEQKKEYYEQNKEYYKEKKKEYYEANKDQIKEKVKCDICCKELRKSSLLRHKKSQHN